ncbi:MAG: hypothetical protein MUF31_13825 [Akkermansiaceae bacterium]|jgi:hypothetical protein|nr:hypothetical protein [Akkermansiaceae bacterium]
MNGIFRWLLAAMALWLVLPAAAQDRGRDVLGRLKVEVYFGSYGDIAVAGPRAREVERAVVSRFQDQQALRFANYRLMGGETKPVFRSYENWAQPIAGSDEILCRFEVENRMSKDHLRMDLELWLSRKKILKSGIALSEGKPVLVLGPEWRGGRLIIAMELLPKEDP